MDNNNNRNDIAERDNGESLHEGRQGFEGQGPSGLMLQSSQAVLNKFWISQEW